MKMNRSNKQQQGEEPEITVAAARLASERFGASAVEAEAYQVPQTEYEAPKEATTAEVPPPFQGNATDDDLPTANARPTTGNRRTNKFGRPLEPQSGEELLRRMKYHRKAATVNSGLWGGLLGLVLLGPIGAVGVGAGSAILTKASLKRREKVLRKRLEGRLHEPIYLI